MDLPTFQDERFGIFRYDERAQRYEGTMQLVPGHPIGVTIDTAGMAPGKALEEGREICRTVIRREQEYRRATAVKLVDLYNESWRNGGAINIDGFMGKVTISSLSIAPFESGATVYYADGGLFAGHLIEVILDAEFRFRDAQLIG